MSRIHGRTHRLALLLLAGVLAGASILPATGCSRPQIFGEGRFHDFSKVKIGMTELQVRGIMGSHYKLIWEEGMQGSDMGIFAWEYAEGRVYFNLNGVMKVVPF